MDLDTAYENAAFIPDAELYPERWAKDAFDWRSVEASIGRARLNQAYGAGERQAFDLFYPAGRPKGLVVFVHGGYWRRFDRTQWSHFSSGATGEGWAVAMPSYTLAPTARIAEITTEVAVAIEAASGFVEGPIRLMGHSAGGHLVARMAQHDGPLAPAVAERVERVVPISPVTDLRPLLQTRINDDLRLDAQEAESESPLLARPRPGLPVSVWVGAEERPAFLDQARWLSEAWSAPLHVAPGRHHFDVIDGLRDKEDPLLRDLLSA